MKKQNCQEMQYHTFAILLTFGFLMGCGGRITPSIVIPVRDVTGNWQIQTGPGVVSNNLAVSLFGALSNVGSQVTGTLRLADLVPGNGCNPFLQPLTVTGTIDSAGHLALTSAQFSGSVLKVALTLPDVLTNTGDGTLEIDGPTCNFPSSAAISNQVALIQGVFTGTLSPAQVAGNTASGTGVSLLTLVQSPIPSNDGRFALSGTFQFTGTACSVTTPVSGKVSGLGVEMIAVGVPGTSSSVDAQISGPVNPTGLAFDHIDVVFSGPPCAKLLPVSYVGSLVRQ